MDITRASFYKHGVGFFNRKATVDGDDEIQVYFDLDQMDDILKSLTVTDLGGGYIANVAYDSHKEESNRFSLKENESLNSILSQLKGISISLVIKDKVIEGTVMGLQRRVEKINEIPIETDYLILSTDTGIEQYSIPLVRNIKIKDKEVAEELERCLKASLKKHTKGKKRITIYCRGDGKRDIIISHLSAVSAWKTCYRMVLTERTKLLLAWGLIDNDTEEDWKDISISLIDGKPISFTYNLYAPHYPVRPHVEIEKEVAVKPVMLEAGSYKKKMSAKEFARLEETPCEVMEDLCLDDAGPLGGSLDDDANHFGSTSIRSQVEMKDAGDMCEYSISNPVTVRKNESASLPLFQESFEGGAILVYNATERPVNPMSVIDFTNTTGMSLNGGPLLVIEGDNYVGEAMLPSMKADEKRFIPFSVELGVKVAEKNKSDNLPIHFIKITDGVMHQYYYHHDIKEYRITNRGKEKTLIIEHPRNEHYELLEPKKADEETDNFYRFKIILKAQSEQTFTVTMQNRTYIQIFLPNQNKDDLQLLMDKKYLTRELTNKVNSVIDLLRRRSEMEAEIEKRREEIDELTDDQERIRENLNSLGNEKQEKQIKSRFLDKLTAHEDKMENFNEEIKSTEEIIKTVNKEISKKLKVINFETEVEVEVEVDLE